MDKNLFKDRIVKLHEGIWEVEDLPNGEYDNQAVKYDKLISNALYNRIMWGNSPKDYADFLRENLKNCGEGIIADIGCGTLSFTSEIYSEYQKQNLFLCDISIEMLKIGKNRLESHNNKISPMLFLRADALNMPFKNDTIQTVLSFGILHIFDNPSRLIMEFNRILKPGGQLHITSLCTDRKLSAKYLNFLHKKGHVARPINSQEIKSLIENNGFKITKSNVKGGMMYLTAYKHLHIK